MKKSFRVLTMILGVAATMIATVSGVQAQEQRHTIACTPERENEVWAYQSYAGLQLLTASSYIGSVKNGTGDPARFDYWFGNHEAGTVQAVEDMMNLIYNGTMAQAQYRCDCAADADPSWVAYVTPTDPDYNVYLCEPFFTQAAENFNVWVLGVVSHELSHFWGTQDYPFGDAYLPNYPDAAHQLAVDHPELAINTSYNYQFFLSESAP